MTRIALAAAAFSLIVGGVMAWYAFFKKPEGLPPRGSMVMTAYIDPEVAARPGCARRLPLVVTVLNTACKPVAISSLRFLAGRRTSLDADVSPRRVGAKKQVALRFDVAALYARLRARRIARSITRVELRDGAGFRYRSPVALNFDGRVCGH
jgi:hypothetical protein